MPRVHAEGADRAVNSTKHPVSRAKIQQVKQRPFLKRAGRHILDYHRAGGERRRYPALLQRRRSYQPRACAMRPDRGEVAFAGSFRADQQHVLSGQSGQASISARRVHWRAPLRKSSRAKLSG